MRRHVLLLTAFLFCTRALHAQPAVLPPQAPHGTDHLTNFDYRQAEIRWSDNHWQLMAGDVWLKDFGKHEAEAREALHILQTLHLTQHGTVGDQPVLEYWLADGHAPQAVLGLRTQPIDLNTLRIEQQRGMWVLRDARRLLFVFGSQRDQAQEALDVLHRYHFTQVGTVGHSPPSMLYFLGGEAGPTLHPASLSPTPILHRAAASETTPSVPAQTPPGQNGSSQEGTGTSAPFHFGREMSSDMHHTATLNRGDRMPFDNRQVQLRNDRQDWKLTLGGHVLADFGPDQDAARLALRALQFYHFTELYSLGHPASFTYFLSNGQAPRGQLFGPESLGFRPETVAVRQIGQNWVVCDGDLPLVGFANHEEDARQLLQIIQHFHFDHLYRIGHGAGHALMFLVRER
jgi:hypothetical protein